MNKLKILIITLLAALIAAPAFAQNRVPGPDRMQPPHPRMQMMKGWMQQLDLSDQQKEEMKQIRLETMEQMVPLRNQLREKRAELRTLTSGDNADFGAAEGVVEEMADLRAEMMKLHLKSYQQIRNLLTDEQKVKFDARPGFIGDEFMHGMRKHRR